MHGGDYDAFEELIILFFENLRDCDIHPYVVLDGGADHTDKKWDTLRKRKQEKINEAFTTVSRERAKVLPILVKNVFRQLLHKLKVPLIQCLEEADWEIAALAKEWIVQFCPTTVTSMYSTSGRDSCNHTFPVEKRGSEQTHKQKIHPSQTLYSGKIL